MIARSSNIHHKASGLKVNTPLLIPSFSSKGFNFKVSGKKGIDKIYHVASEFFTKACLVSAYDIYYKYITEPLKLETIPELFFLDSGGYEVSETDDYSTVVHVPVKAKKWNVQLYKEVLANWPKEYSSVFVSYDNPKERKSLEDQIEIALDIFSNYSDQLNLFLIKPESENDNKLKDDVIKKIIINIDRFSKFDIIGLTEKELGPSILDRMVNISRVRKALDEASISAPLHIFGALDPISVCLYFLAGAEIFDGLTWLRYSYYDNTCIYPHNYGFLKWGIQTTEKQIALNSIRENIYNLENIEYILREFLDTKDFSKFGIHADRIKSAMDRLGTKVKGVK